MVDGGQGKNEEGLGIDSLKSKNKTLLFKWL